MISGGQRPTEIIRGMAVLLDLVLPPRCPGCGVEGAPICARCMRPLERRLGEPPGLPIGLSGDLPEGLAQLEWCAAFTGPVRAALLALKYDGERRVAEPLGRVAARRWRHAGVGGELIVPVPIHADRLRTRGYDQAELLARVVARELHLPVVPAVVRATATTAQYRLGRAGRAANVGHAFACRREHLGHVRGRHVVLVDDIVTTGATLSGCAAALYVGGARCVSALTIARER
jgi:ComF family protein